MNDDGVPMSYVIRDTNPPSTFSTLMEELCYLLQLDMSDANFRRDSNIVYALLDQQVKAALARPHFMHKANMKDQNGRTIFLALCSYLEGENARTRKISEAEEAIHKLVWNFSPSFPPESFTAALLKQLNKLEENGEVWDNAKKIRTMRLSILPNNPEIVSKNAWINNLKEKLEDMGETWSFQVAVQHFNEKGRQHCKKSKRGISSINGKKGKGNKSKKGRGAPKEENVNDLGPNASEQRQKERGFKKNGKPTQNVIEGVDISPILKLKSRIAPHLFECLPRIVKMHLYQNYINQMEDKGSRNSNKPSFSLLKSLKIRLSKS